MTYMLKVKESRDEELPIYLEDIELNPEGGYTLMYSVKQYAMIFENRVDAEEFKEYYDHLNKSEVVDE